MAKRLIDADALMEHIKDLPTWWPDEGSHYMESMKYPQGMFEPDDIISSIENAPTVEVVHGEWKLIAHKERANDRWNVTAQCSECGEDKGEIWAGFFPGIPDNIANFVTLQSAESVKLSNYCSNCGAKMYGGTEE